MPDIGDVVELVHEQSYLGQQVNNVYFFQNTDGAATLQSLAAWFETNIVFHVLNAQSALVSHVNLRLRNLFDASEAYEEPLAASGAVATTTDELPSFVALTIRLDHGLGSPRPGFKRFVGVTEAMITDGLVNSTYITQLNLIGDDLINPPGTALTGYQHVIVGRVCEIANPDPDAVPSCLKYRLPENVGEAVLGYPTSYTAYAQPTTQNSRKWYA